MDGTGKWVAGGVLGLLGIFGLLAASRAADSAFYYGGFIVFLAAVAVIFRMIGSAFDAAERKAHSNGH